MDRIKVWRSAGGMWRWRMQAPNRRIIGASTEGYHRKLRCIENLQAVTGHYVIFSSVEDATQRAVRSVERTFRPKA